MKNLIINEQRMTSLEIAEMTGKNHCDLLRSIRKMEDAWIKVNQSKFAFVDYVDKKGEVRPCYSLTKTECLYIATKFNDEARAKLILRWKELEEDRQQTQINTDGKFLNQKMSVAKFAMENLKLNDVSKLMIVKSVCEGYDIPLPEYVKSEGVLKCATDLLKERFVNFDVREFNRLMINRGYMIEAQRRTSKGETKTFKVLTTTGLCYGENLVSPKNPLETQPKYYVEDFDALIGMLTMDESDFNVLNGRN